MSNVWNGMENFYKSVRGSFTPEQFGVFLNMHSCEVDDNYLIAFHENFHYWQSVFTPYGHMKWACDRSVSADVVNIWLSATKESPSARFLPAAGMVSSNDDKQRAGAAEIYIQELTRQMVYASERVGNNPKLYRMLTVGKDELAPTIDLDGKKYQMNGIDILESYAKYQEAVLAFLVEDKQFAEAIDPEKLRPEYYSAFSYFIDKVGTERILEFPVACELALSASRPCFIDQQDKWKEHYPAWRYIRIIDVISRYEQAEYLSVSNLEANFTSYVDMTLRNCGYMGWDDCWDSVVKYAEQSGMNISNDMVRAIEFKREYPWVLSFPFINSEVYRLMKEFHPYFYVMTDSSRYAVDSEIMGQEVVFENHFQAFAHQICGHISPRCIDCGKVQCGFSYYGIKGCQYLLDGSCDGHVDRDSELPRIVLDENRNIVEGCLFEAFLNVMGVEVKDLVVTDISKRIDPDMFKKAN